MNNDLDKPWKQLPEIERYLEPELFYEDKKFKPSLFAGHLVFTLFNQNEMSGINRGFLVMKDTGQIYRFNGKYYEPDGEVFIKGKLQRVLGSDIHTYHKNEAIQWVKDHEDLQTDRAIFEEHPEKIVLDNCMFDIIKNEVDEPSPNAFNLSVFPIEYNPQATCEKFQEFLEQILYEKDIPVVQEMFGYCFYKPYVFQKSFMMVGGGANGKSTLLSILSMLLGDQNISSIPLQNLCKDRFTNIDLYGKYANICSDLSDSGIRNTGTFKMLTGGDYIRAEIKHKPNGILFKNTAKLIFSCNIIPESPDDSEAYHRRWIVIQFPNQFREKDPDTDPYMKDKLINELPGIFNWSMVGLNRLLSKGVFSDHRTLQDVTEFMAEKQDPVNQFITQCVIPGNHDNVISKSVMYDHYLDYCSLFGKPSVAMNQFSMKFKQYAPRVVTEGQTKKLGKLWRGLTVKVPSKEKEPNDVSDITKNEDTDPKSFDVSYETIKETKEESDE